MMITDYNQMEVREIVAIYEVLGFRFVIEDGKIKRVED